MERPALRKKLLTRPPKGSANPRSNTRARSFTARSAVKRRLSGGTPPDAAQVGRHDPRWRQPPRPDPRAISGVARL